MKASQSPMKKMKNTSFGEFISGSRHIGPSIDFNVPFVEKASFKTNKFLARSKLSALQVPLENTTSPSQAGTGFSPRMSHLNFGNGPPQLD
jgi:hypothetical protein